MRRSAASERSESCLRIATARPVRNPQSAIRNPQSNVAFTLIELLTVIAIIGIMAALVAPVVGNFRKGDATIAATQQMLADVGRARQLAIAEHTTVYMIFVPTNFWTGAAYSLISPADRVIGTNLLDKQLTGYTFITPRSIGDQPGRPNPRYLTLWQTLPESTFIPTWKFGPRNAFTQIVDPVTHVVYPVRGFQVTNSLPFPNLYVPQPYPPLPFIAFDSLGQIVSDFGEDEYIPIAHGSVGVPHGPNKVPIWGPATPVENPPSNSILSYNLIHIDHFTGRARLEHQQVQ